MSDDVSEIKARLNIVDVIGDYLKLQKAGSNWKALSPFTNEKTPSFMVSEEKQIWHCFSSGRGGDIFTFVMEMEGVEFFDALKILAQKAGVTLYSQGRGVSRKSQSHSERLFSLLELSTRFWEKQLWDGVGRKEILPYLHTRGMHDDVIRNFRLGFAPPGWCHLMEFLSRRGYTQKEMSDSGVLVSKESGKAYDRFRSRIIFPITDSMGKVVGFSGRAAPGDDEGGAKYINTPETPVYHKSRILYGYFHAKNGLRNSDHAIVVEGNMDVLALFQVGFLNAVAVSGTSFTDEQLSLLRRYVDRVVLFFDMDEAGQNAGRKSAMLCFRNGFSVSVVELPSGKDAADFAKDDPDSLRMVVESARNAMEVFFDQVFSRHDVSQVEGKKRIVSELCEIISAFSNDVERMHWISELSARTQIPESVLVESVSRFSSASFSVSSHPQSPSSEKKDFSSLSRFDVICERIIEILLTNPSFWKKISMSRDSVFKFLAQADSRLALVLTEGERAGFSVSTFFSLVYDSETKRTFERIYAHATSFVFDEDRDDESIENYFSQLVSSLRDLSLRERRNVIIQSLHSAEREKDVLKIKKLREEFSALLEK